MRTALIAGATGLVGSFLLQNLLEDPLYRQVKILVRKPLEIKHPRLVQQVVDYQKLDLADLSADDVCCCLGTTIKKAGSREVFRKVDHDYPLALAQAALGAGARRFALVSAMGANARSRIFYNRVKGEVEDALRQLPLEVLCIMQPSLLLGPRKEYRTGEEVAKLLAQVMALLMPANYKAIHASQVAAAMQDTLKSASPGIHVVLSGQMQRWPVKKTI